MTRTINHANSFAFPPKLAGAGNHTGVLRRVFDALVASRQRHADQDIARFIESHGAHLTDDVERQLNEHFSKPAFGRPLHL